MGTILRIDFAKGPLRSHFSRTLHEPLQILIIGDGKPGHENQSLGLAEAMGRLRPVEINRISVGGKRGPVARIRHAFYTSKDLPRPHFVIAAGHSTHLPLLRVCTKYEVPSVVLMKPSLYAGFFTWCVIPEHDCKRAPSKANIITSKGALNRVVPGAGPRNGKLFLVGGPSKTHGYDEAALLQQIEEIGGDGWGLADSRRTPPSLLPALAKRIPGLEVFPHQETKPGWLAEKLSNAEEIRVTEDSVSMIYEALSSGAKVRILEMPRIRHDSRVLRGLDVLRKDGYFGATGSERPPVLAEADRCARIILGS